MTYNLTNIYGNGVIGNLYYTDLASNGILLDVLIVVGFVVIYSVLSGKQYNAKNSLLMTCFIMFVVTGAMTFAVAASGFNADQYFVRTIIMFAASVAALLYHILSD
jgi:hypothetical protein